MPVEKALQGSTLPRDNSPQAAPTRRDVLIGAGLTAGALTAPAACMGSDAAWADHAAPAMHQEGKSKKHFEFGHEPARGRMNFYDLTEDEVRAFCNAVGYMRDGKK